MNAVVASEPPYLRALVPDDLDQLTAIEAHAYARGGWSLGIFADCLRAGYFCRGLDYCGELAGYGILSVAAEESHLLNLAVNPRWQRQGFARRLLAHVADLARRSNAQCMFLEVRPSNAAALSLYSQVGFTRFGRRRGYYPPTAEGESEDALVLCLRL